MNADNDANVEKIVSFYTEDAILMPAGKPNISGKDAIRKNYENIFASSKLQLSASASEVINEGNAAVIIGNTTGRIISLADSSVHMVDDKFIMVLKKITGEWKIHRLMWSKNQ